MRLLINHQTLYRYSAPVQRSLQYLRMTPQTNGYQNVLNWALATPGIALEQRDGFDNIWTSLSVTYPHDSMTIMAQGCVELDMTVEGIRDERISPYFFQYPTAVTQPDAAIRELAAAYLTQGSRAELIRLSEAIIERMPYTSNATTVDTTAMEALQLGKGVCQDHTHVLLACAREAGLAARYVSGYLYTLSPDHLASHAWAEVLIDGLWHCFDVSNQLFTHSQHVQVAVGRDYLDTAPIRGVRTGGGEEQTTVLVQVLPT